MMKKSSKPAKAIWVVAADRTRARLFETPTPAAPLVERAAISNPDVGALERDLHRHETGKVISGVTGRHTAFEPHQSGREFTDEAFAKSICERVEELRVANALARMYLIANPHMLGLLRRNLSKDSAELVAGEVSRDPSHDDATQLRATLPEQL